MRKLLFLSMFFFGHLSVFAQPKLEKLWESDTAGIVGPESVLFDARTQSLYVSNMNAGSVARLDLNGKLLKKDLVTGLNANKGSAFYKGDFYTAETAAVAVVDGKTFSVKKRVPVKNAVMLNDLAIDAKGVIYVSDTRAGNIYRIKDDKVELYLDNLPGANGLLPVGDDLYVVTSTSFLKVGPGKNVEKIAEDFESGLDGIAMLSARDYILSNYKGMLYYVKSDGSKQVLLDSRATNRMANDIGYDIKTRTLYVPSYRSNLITAYRIK